jgi:copper homeostasis protein
VAKLVELAYPMEVTFHRAFDHAAEPLKALEDIIDCGCQRILTSGGRNTAIEGQELIKSCAAAADGRIIILPGAGIRSGNIRALAEATGLQEFHSSARRLLPSGMLYRNTSIQELTDSTSVDINEIERCRAALEGLE